ncbi:MAG TPA: hypothetical protein VNT99_02375 [Methylomirabilota bacterium]|nr:hypothetical protein [Methylomirabilota bacterium]
MSAAFPVAWAFDAARKAGHRRLALALAASLLMHGSGYAVWKVMPPISVAVKSAVARVLPKNFADLQPNDKLPERPPKREVPLFFVEVDPAQATVEPPNTKYHSTHNSTAANPEPKKADVPKIDGTQKHVIRTMDIEKSQPKPLQPAPLALKPAEPKAMEANPKPLPEAGDLAMAKVESKPLPPSKGDGDKDAEMARPKPRTVAEAKARMAPLAGRKLDQDGGVPTRRPHISLDAKGSPFGNYDSVFINMVEQRWYSLLDNNRFMLDRRGKVSLTFELHYDGRITNLRTQEQTVDEVWAILCQKAILDPAPFPKWPTSMRQVVGSDVREVRFTFYYD